MNSLTEINERLSGPAAAAPLSFTLRSKTERIGDESLLPLFSGFVHGYILWFQQLVHRLCTV
jgi:hypothetical protein